MPFREPALSLREIAEAIGATKEFTQGVDAAALGKDAKTVAAVERNQTQDCEACDPG